jgi:hypothetical protein
MPQYLPFKEIAESVDAEAVARHVGLAMKRSGKELRSACPSCNSDDERALAIFPETNSFRCYASQLSGDCIALYGHLTGTGMYQSAKYLQEQFGAATAAHTTPVTTPQKPGVAPSPPASSAAPAGSQGRSVPFDPQKFLAKLDYTSEVQALGISQEDAEALGIGVTRGKLWIALRHDDGSIAGFAEVTVAKLPKTLLPRSGNVVRFPKTA